MPVKSPLKAHVGVGCNRQRRLTSEVGNDASRRSRVPSAHTEDSDDHLNQSRDQGIADLEYATAINSGQPIRQTDADAYAEARDERDATKRARGSTAAVRARTTGRR